MAEFFPIPGCRIEQVMRADPMIVQISAQGTQPGGACPNCHTVSQAVHSRYRRHPADLPNLGSEVRLVLSVRRFYCRNMVCPRRTFAEPLPDLLAPWARRTRRLAVTQGKVGVTCGGEAGARGHVAPCDAVSPPMTNAAPVLPASRQLAWLLVQSPEALDESEKVTLAWIVQDAEVARVSTLIPRFADLVRSCGISRDKAPADLSSVLKSWLDEAGSCGIQAVETVAAGLRQDQAAIQAALTLPWSSGQAEGQINRLKLIKRQMYGRANFDLLRRRVLLAA
jgi:transposase